MKRTIIACTIASCGVLIVSSIFISAAVYAPSITAWSGSKFWFAIFGTRRFGNEAVQSLSLSIPFIIGSVMTVIGMLMAVTEYIKGNKDRK